MSDHQDPRPEGDSQRTSMLVPTIVLGVIAAFALIYLFFFQSDDRAPEPEPVPQPVLSPPSPEPTPVPQPTLAPTDIPSVSAEPKPTPVPLPELNTSDEPLAKSLEDKGLGDLVVYLTPDEVIRKTARAVYSLSKGNVVQQYRPVNGPDSAFTATATGDTVTIENPRQKGEMTETPVYRLNVKNAERYTPLVNLLRTTDKATLVSVYERYYPLLQQAYQELGEGPADFHKVVLASLDSMINAPDPREEPKLIRTSVQYQFLKPEYEALPQAQKLMLRMGKMNRRVLVEELKTLRAALADAQLGSAASH